MNDDKQTFNVKTKVSEEKENVVDKIEENTKITAKIKLVEQFEEDQYIGQLELGEEVLSVIKRGDKLIAGGNTNAGLIEEYTFDYDDTLTLDENLQEFVSEIEAGVNNEEIPVEEYKNRFEESKRRLKESHAKALAESKEAVVAEILESIKTSEFTNDSLKELIEAKMDEAREAERASIMEDLKEDVIELNEMVDSHISTKLDEQREEIYQDVRDDLEEIDEALYETLKEDLKELDEGIETYLKDDKVVTGEDGDTSYVVNDENEVVDKVEEDVIPDKKFKVFVTKDGVEDIITVDARSEDEARLKVTNVNSIDPSAIIKVEAELGEACEKVGEGDDFDGLMNQKNIDVEDVRDALTDLEGDVESLKAEDFQAEDFLTDMGMEDFGMEDFGFDEDFGMFDLEDADKDFLIESVKQGKIKSKDQLKKIVESMGKNRYEKDIKFKMKKVFEAKEKAEHDKAIAESVAKEEDKKKLAEAKAQSGELSEHELFMNHFVDKKFMV